MCLDVVWQRWLFPESLDSPSFRRSNRAVQQNPKCRNMSMFSLLAFSFVRNPCASTQFSRFTCRPCRAARWSSSLHKLESLWAILRQSSIPHASFQQLKDHAFSALCMVWRGYPGGIRYVDCCEIAHQLKGILVAVPAQRKSKVWFAMVCASLFAVLPCRPGRRFVLE